MLLLLLVQVATLSVERAPGLMDAFQDDTLSAARSRRDQAFVSWKNCLKRRTNSHLKPETPVLDAYTAADIECGDWKLVVRSRAAQVLDFVNQRTSYDRLPAEVERLSELARNEVIGPILANRLAK